MKCSPSKLVNKDEEQHKSNLLTEEKEEKKMNARFLREAENVVNHRNTRTVGNGLGMRTFNDDQGVPVTAIEQNPNTRSQGAQLAREGHKVVQFKQDGKYIGMTVDGKWQEY